MPSVRIVFRNFPASAELNAAAPEVLVFPCSTDDRDRVDLAALVLEQGLDGLVQGDGPIDSVVVPLGPSSPTLDDMLAASFALRLASGQPIPEGAKPFARYSAVLRKGLRPGKIPTEVSLEGIFLAIRNSVAADLSDPKAAQAFLAGWSRMFDRILSAAERNHDPFSMALFSDDSDFAEERAFLVNDRNVYRQDVKRGRQWIARLPNDLWATPTAVSDTKHTAVAGKPGPQRSSVLILDRPKSLLFKYWARIDRDSPTAEGYLLLGVRGGDQTWIFSTDPAQRLSLKSLADRLQKAEESETTDSTEPQTDPWFDGDRFAHSLIASPRRGTRLPEDKVLGVVKQWAHAAPPRPEIRKFAIPALVAGVLLLILVPGLMALRRPSDPVKPPRHDESQSSARGETTAAVAADFNPEKGKLLVLAIGADYKKRGVTENACKKDAERLAGAFQSQQGVFFKHVSVTTLLNDRAKKDAILSELDEIRKEATDGDLVVVTLAGHGTVDQDNNYFFLPYDYDPTKVLPSTGVSWDDFHRAFRPLHCTVLVIADTCHSGAITRTEGARDGDEDAMQNSINKAVNDFRQAQAGLIVIAASLAEGLAKQNRDYGYLSQAVYEAVTGEPGDSTARDEYWPKPSSDGLVTLETLRSYVIHRVHMLSSKTQKVVANHTGNIHFDDIPIAIRRPSTTRPTANVNIAEPGRPAP